MKWTDINKELPKSGIRVRLAKKVYGIGAPEREGWETTGWITDSGKWSLKQTENKDIDYNSKPTHWKTL